MLSNNLPQCIFFSPLSAETKSNFSFLNGDYSLLLFLLSIFPSDHFVFWYLAVLFHSVETVDLYILFTSYTFTLYFLGNWIILYILCHIRVFSKFPLDFHRVEKQFLRLSNVFLGCKCFSTVPDKWKHVYIVFSIEAIHLIFSKLLICFYLQLLIDHFFSCKS